MARPALKQKIFDVLKKHFPTETVDVSNGAGDNLHVVVVSQRFRGKTAQEREESLWQLLDESLSAKESSHISLLVALSPEDVKMYT